MGQFLTKNFLKGLAVILPLAITMYFLYWLGSAAEKSLGRAIQAVLPEGWYVRGLGVVAGIALVFSVGLLMRVWITRQLVRLGERVLDQIPLVKTVYGSVRDLMGFFADDEQKQKMDQVVLIKFEQQPIHMLGFVTQSELKLGVDDLDQKIAVYLPMSYQIGGFTVMVPKSALIPVDLSIEQGLRFAMTAGISTQSK